MKEMLRRLDAAAPAWVQFGVGAAAVVAAIFFGLSWRAWLWDQPIAAISVSGPSQYLSITLGNLAGLGGAVLAGVVGYLVCLRALARGFRHAGRAALVASVLAFGAALPMAPLSSPDAVHLAADVRTLWLHGRYPARFEASPGRVDDPVAEHVITYRNSPSGYGPVSYIVGGAALPFVGDDFRANVLGTKVVAGLGLLTCGAAAAAVARRLGGSGAMAFGAIGLHPLLLWEYPGGGHNDTIMAALALGGVALVIESRVHTRVLGVTLGILSVLAKFTTLVVAPFVIAYWYPRSRKLLAAAAAASPFLLIAWFRRSNALAAEGPAESVSFPTLWGAVADALGTTSHLTDGFYLAAGAVAAGLLVWHPWRRPVDVVNGIAALLAFFVLAFPGYHPWYQVWYFPFAMVSSYRWLRRAALVFSLGALFPVLALHFSAVLERDLHVPDPVHTTAILLWGAVALVIAHEALAAGQRGTMRR